MSLVVEIKLDTILIQTIEQIKRIFRIQDYHAWDIATKLKKCKVFCGRGSLLKRSCQPTVRENRSHFIFHIGTNDLSPRKSPERIPKLIAGVGSRLKYESRDINISIITVRNENFKERAAGVMITDEDCLQKGI